MNVLLTFSQPKSLSQEKRFCSEENFAEIRAAQQEPLYWCINNSCSYLTSIAIVLEPFTVRRTKAHSFFLDLLDRMWVFSSDLSSLFVWNTRVCTHLLLYEDFKADPEIAKIVGKESEFMVYFEKTNGS